jgi:hypothetical protein
MVPAPASSVASPQVLTALFDGSLGVDIDLTLNFWVVASEFAYTFLTKKRTITMKPISVHGLVNFFICFRHTSVNNTAGNLQ